MPLQEEVGPYTFQKVRLKRGVEWVRGGASVRWREYRYHLPVPELSNGSLDDPITTLNVPLLGERAWAGLCGSARLFRDASSQVLPRPAALVWVLQPPLPFATPRRCPRAH